MGERDYYEILEVHPKASQAVIDKAYRVLAQRYHPDKHFSYRKKWAEAKFKELSQAHEVLSNSESRREYDQVRHNNIYSFRKAYPSREYSSNQEEAYFYYRTGLAYYKKVVEKKSFWYGYTGKWESGLKEAQHNFLEVIKNHSNSSFTEEAGFYYFCTLTRKCDYTKEHKAKVQEEFERFSANYPNSKWMGEALFELAGFYLFKGFEFNKTIKILEDFLKYYPKHKWVKVAWVLLEFARIESKRYCSSCDKRLRGKKNYCFHCGKSPIS